MSCGEQCWGSIDALAAVLAAFVMSVSLAGLCALIEYKPMWKRPYHLRRAGKQWQLWHWDAAMWRYVIVWRATRVGGERRIAELDAMAQLMEEWIERGDWMEPEVLADVAEDGREREAA